MKSLKQRVIMAGTVLAIVASFGASAADQSAFFAQQLQMTDGNPGEYLPAQPSKSTTAAIVKRPSTKMAASPKVESRNFENFENQVQLTDGEQAKTVSPGEIVK